MMLKATIIACALQFIIISHGVAEKNNPCLPCNSSNPNLACQQQTESGKNCTRCVGKDDTACEDISCSPDCPDAK